MSLGTSLQVRSGYDASRLIALCPADEDHNSLMACIMNDIVKVTVHGVLTRNPSRERVMVLLGMFCFLGGYPAVTTFTEDLDIPPSPFVHCVQ